MSEPKKVIEIEKGSLLSLKAELLKLKKQTEELKNKEAHKPRKLKKNKESSVDNLDEKKIVEVDDSSEFERSKRILEAKTKYYERMTKNKINSPLVLFKDKAENEAKECNDFIEFTDSFGRTRKVEKSEYEKIKDPADKIVDKHKEIYQNTEFLKQKEEWKKQEELNKDRNELYYQDILFDEARLHGTAWYKFSLDHQERMIQQENLIKMREKTEQAQSKRVELKKHRDDIIKNRIKLAKQRMRSKLGLPIEQTVDDDKISDNNSKDDDRQETKEHAEKAVVEKELQKEKERKRHIRPWDIGKGNEKGSNSNYDEWMPKKEKFLLSQDEWNEIQRTKRVNEFGPSCYDKPKGKEPANLEQSVIANLKYIREKFENEN